MKKLLAVVSILITGLLLAGQTLFAQAKAEVKMEWLSHSHFRFTSPNGKILLTNPHLDNADNKTKLEEITKADVIVVADGHRDEIGKAPEIAAKTGAKIVAPRELALGYLKMVEKVPDKQLVLASIGDRFNIDGVTVRVVHHSWIKRAGPLRPLWRTGGRFHHHL
jgi:L-ascorbate metabolism protein UlaG (beta-lactamase superfamily)